MWSYLKKVMGNKTDNYETTSSEIEDTNDAQQPKAQTRDAVIFSFLGLLNFTVFYLGMSAAQDILAGTSIPTSSVLLCMAIPLLITTLLAPHVNQVISPTVRVLTLTVLATAGILSVSIGTSVPPKLMGICLVSLGFGIAETCFLSLTAFYHTTTVSAYCGGTGIGYVFGPLYYTALTTWACVPPRTALLTVSGFPVVILLLYIFLKKPTATKKDEVTVHTELLSVHDEPELQQQYTWTEKVQSLKRTLALVITQIFGVFFEYLTVQAVVTTLAFPNSPFSPRDHYQFYFFVFSFGEFSGRSYSLFAYCWKSLSVLTEKTWIFAAMLGVNLIFTSLASWYRFLPSVWPVFLVLFEHGALAGALYVNTYGTAGKYERQVLGKEFSRAFSTVGSAIGLSIAGFVGLALEPYLRNHCLSTSTVGNGDFCFTRKVYGYGNNTFVC